MRKAIGYTLTALLIAGLAGGVGFRITHHPVYGKCHQTAEGWACKLIKWEGN